MPNPFARDLASMFYGKPGVDRLDAGLCPCCGSRPENFRDALSRAEAGSTGLCQACQDGTISESHEEQDI